MNKYLAQNTVVYQPGHTYSAYVKRVIDGDTFVIESNERVRLIGIDTPETVHPRRGVEPYGPEASEFTKNAIEGKQIRLEFDVEIYDMFKRLLAYVYVDNMFLNEQLLMEGLAVM
ncbi:MAG: thermonuclease family protein [Bacteroidales bacterium]|nr:thermonuclease family protein [Bacteroidales bacterium]